MSEMIEVKCHQFVWSIHCSGVSPDNFWEFDDEFREAICPLLIKCVGVEDMNDYPFFDAESYNMDGNCDYTINIPIDVYDDAEFDEAMNTIDDSAAEYLGGWSFEQKEDQGVWVDSTSEYLAKRKEKGK